ncbi:MAG TPA: hypothetical protein VEW48_07170 [Thermoanaerobaculia bacterium]|nr:hypothetical protein [Thermoanaerobaculia bacterium]
MTTDDTSPALRAVLVEKLGESLTNVRTPEGREVDFLVRSPGSAAELIQVCADSTSAAVAERELRALEEAGRLFPDAQKRLLTLTLDGVPREVPPGVAVQPAYEWLLTR